MDEYIERAVLNTWLHETMSAQTTTIGMAYVRDFWNKVLSMPAADVAHVVRCKDCKHRENCNLMADDDFCSDGERKDGE